MSSSTRNQDVRTMAVYAAIFLLLLAVYVLQETVQRPRNAVDVPSVDDISAVVIGDISLARGGNGEWTVGDAGYPADTDTIDDLTTLLRGLDSLPSVSDRGRFDEYGLSGDQALEISIRGNNSYSIALGDDASGGSGVYGRIDDGRSIVLLPDAFSRYRSFTADDFRDHLMAEIAEDDVRRVEIAHRSGAAVTMEPREINDDSDADTPRWIATGLDGIGDSAYRNFFSEIESLDAQGFLDAAPTSDPIATISIELADGTSKTVTVWHPDDDRLFPVVVAGNPYPFVVPEWRYRRLVLGVEDFVPPEATPPEVTVQE